MRTRVPRSAALLATALLATACQGGGDDEPAEPEPSPVAPAKMDDVELPEAPDELAKVVQDRMQEALSVEVTMTVEPEDAEEEGASIEDVTMSLLLTDPPSAQMTTVDNSGEEPETAHTVVSDGVVYVMLEGEPLAGEKDWMRLTAEEIDATEDELGPFAEIFRIMHREVNASLEQAAGSSSMDVVALGELDGDPEPDEGENGPVTRFTGTTETRALADKGDDDFKNAADAGLEEVSWELTVGPKGLPEEFTVQMVTPDEEEAVSTVHYTNWGEELEVSPPPEDNTGTLQESLDTA
ncbi:hypothetical protein O4J56_10470 [Nocardiopsis sp. RSe5-2]|uniref:LppX_LprAFG lipoprotein n=1 Tax=Nocardiopsis endophytica TaxID=3018445 RepID=A0ABT4U296_9ACTN|nr:hypothetical protein [Nocardiopsis endophytica]MDA2811060.1 hypothetical protein [Nocardiopsis endophytica]